MKRFGILFAASAILALSATAARADTLTYTESTTASGALDGSSFSNALVTLTLTGNTANITGSSPVLNLVGPTTVSVAGIGSDTFTFNAGVTVNQGQGGVTGAGIGDADANVTILFTNNSAFSTYALTTPIGPLSGLAGDNLGFDFATAGGSFDLTSIDAVGAAPFTTFTAVASTATTPEPASLLLLATALAAVFGLSAMKRRVL
jgi:hypothetical protein